MHTEPQSPLEPQNGKDIGNSNSGYIGFRVRVYRGYIGTIGYILGLYRDKGKEKGNYSMGSRIHNLGSSS